MFIKFLRCYSGADVHEIPALRPTPAMHFADGSDTSDIA